LRSQGPSPCCQRRANFRSGPYFVKVTSPLKGGRITRNDQGRPGGVIGVMRQRSKGTLVKECGRLLPEWELRDGVPGGFSDGEYVCVITQVSDLAVPDLEYRDIRQDERARRGAGALHFLLDDDDVRVCGAVDRDRPVALAPQRAGAPGRGMKLMIASLPSSRDGTPGLVKGNSWTASIAYTLLMSAADWAIAASHMRSRTSRVPDGIGDTMARPP
jgi:hypothetical protein